MVRYDWGTKVSIRAVSEELGKTPEGLQEKKGVPIQEEGSRKEGDTWIAQKRDQSENWVPESWRWGNTGQVLGVEQVGNEGRALPGEEYMHMVGKKNSCAQNRIKFLKG